MQPADLLILAAIAAMLFFGISLVAILLVGIRRLRRRHRRSRLLRKVSAPDRGEPLERELTVNLLEAGVHPATLFHDLYVDLGRDRYSQVDLVALTPRGIIVIEVKDYGGGIFGKGDDTEWVKTLAYGNEKHTFYNPVMQNAGHIRALRNTLRQAAPEARFISVIVFSGRATLHRFDRLPPDTFVCYDAELPALVEKIAHSGPKCRYADKKGVVAALRRAAANGADPAVVALHARNIAALHPRD